MTSEARSEERAESTADPKTILAPRPDRSVLRSVAQPARSPATSSSRRISPAPSAASASRSRRRSCSASTARKACASRATGWASSSASIPTGWSPTPDKSFEQGCIELIGTWKDLGRWKRHIYRGVAETMERKLDLAEGTLLETPWHELAAEAPRHLAVGHRRRAHHVHVAGRQGGRKNTAARSTASFPSCWKSTAPARARRRFASSNNT